MKIELNDKKVIFVNDHNKTEIHPIWLRERVRDEKFLDKNNDQRLFDPSFLENISIEEAKINNETSYAFSLSFLPLKKFFPI